MKKLVLVGSMIALCLGVLLVRSESVSAADISYTIQAVTDSTMITTMNDVNTRKPTWFTDYKYFIYSNTAGTTRYVYLVPNSATTQIIIWKATDDSDQDLDGIYFSAACTSAAPCVRYQYTSAGVYQAVASYTTGFTETNMSTALLHYTNINQVYRQWYLAGSTWVITDGHMDPFNGGIPPLSSAVTDAVGVTTPDVTSGDLQIIDQLKYTGNMLADFFILLANVVIESINLVLNDMAEGNDLISGLLSGLQGDLAGLGSGVANSIGPVFTDVMASLFVAEEQDWIEFNTLATKFENAVPCYQEVGNFFTELGPTGTPFSVISADLFGVAVSFDIKRDVFDPFLPFAPLVKSWVLFGFGFLFVKRMYYEGQSMVNGGSSPRGGTA